MEKDTQKLAATCAVKPAEACAEAVGLAELSSGGLRYKGLECTFAAGPFPASLPNLLIKFGRMRVHIRWPRDMCSPHQLCGQLRRMRKDFRNRPEREAGKALLCRAKGGGQTELNNCRAVIRGPVKGEGICDLCLDDIAQGCRQEHIV